MVISLLRHEPMAAGLIMKVIQKCQCSLEPRAENSSPASVHHRAEFTETQRVCATIAGQMGVFSLGFVVLVHSYPQP